MFTHKQQKNFIHISSLILLIALTTMVHWLNTGDPGSRHYDETNNSYWWV